MANFNGIEGEIWASPTIPHLFLIDLCKGKICLATAFYSGRVMDTLPATAKNIDLYFRLDMSDTDEWERGYINPPALLSFIRRCEKNGGECHLYISPSAHAKIYIGNGGVLIGSSNLTLSGFGGGGEVVCYLDGKDAIISAREEIDKYSKSFKPITTDSLAAFISKNIDIVNKTRRLREPLPKISRDSKEGFGKYQHFISQLKDQQSFAAREVFERAKGKGNLSGHIHRNFYGLRQFFLAYPEFMYKFAKHDENTYKLYRDSNMKISLHDFVLKHAVDEEDFSVSVWKTYLPEYCGGAPKCGGGTLGNLNRMLPLVAKYILRQLTDLHGRKY